MELLEGVQHKESELYSCVYILTNLCSYCTTATNHMKIKVIVNHMTLAIIVGIHQLLLLELNYLIAIGGVISSKLHTMSGY